MRITVFTGNQPRHIALIESLAAVADQVFAVSECTTLFPGRVADFHAKSPVMQEYFSHVLAAEAKVFGKPRFLPRNVAAMLLKSGDLNNLPLESFGAALDSDLFVVFGASFIKAPLIDLLIAKRAYNLHIGVSPYYRGSACNFWVLFDGHAEYAGGTVHLLSRGLDSGPMLLHALPRAGKTDPFVLGMEAVKVTQSALLHYIKNGQLSGLVPVAQDKSKEIRYSRKADFTEDIAGQYLSRLPSADEVQRQLAGRDMRLFLRPFLAPPDGL